MPCTVVVGAQWGDEGKGKIVDALAADADFVARYQGGPNAGHSVVHAGRTLVLHLVPSGILHERCRCLVGNGVVLDPQRLRDEVAELEARGVPLGPPPPDGYAAELRKIVRAHRDTSRAPAAQQSEALVDRLLVAALIEARSCERFRLLSEGLKARGPAELAPFYEELLAAEARHFRTFVDLARKVAHPDEEWVDARLREVARLEGELASRLEGAPAIHG